MDILKLLISAFEDSVKRRLGAIGLLAFIAALLPALVPPVFGIEIESYIDMSRLGLLPTENNPETVKDCEALADEFTQMIEEAQAAKMLCIQNQPTSPRAQSGGCCVMWAPAGWKDFWCIVQAKCAPLHEHQHCLVKERRERVSDCYQTLERKKKFIPLEDLNKHIEREQKIYDATMSLVRKTGEDMLKSAPMSNAFFETSMKLIEMEQKKVLNEMRRIKEIVSSTNMPEQVQKIPQYSPSRSPDSNIKQETNRQEKSPKQSPQEVPPQVKPEEEQPQPPKKKTNNDDSRGCSARVGVTEATVTGSRAKWTFSLAPEGCDGHCNGYIKGFVSYNNRKLAIVKSTFMIPWSKNRQTWTASEYLAECPCQTPVVVIEAVSCYD